jgi:4-amino-4-deoxy-L-arabinose transferase-like glycosyltransferase
MKKLSIYFRRHGRLIIWCLVLGAGILAVMLYRLGAVLPVAGPREHITIDATQLGWSHVLNYPFDLPLTVVRQLVHYLANGDSSLAVERLPSVIFGLMTIGLFAVLIKFWHGTRTALIATVLFACNAWLLHVSRQDTMDILYLWAVPLLLVMQLLMHKYGMHGFVFYGSLAVCGLLLYVPGLVWFVLLSLFWQRKSIRQGWQHFKPWWQRVLYILVGIVWLPLLIRHDTSHSDPVWAPIGFCTSARLCAWTRRPTALARARAAARRVQPHSRTARSLVLSKTLKIHP